MASRDPEPHSGAVPEADDRLLRGEEPGAPPSTPRAPGLRPLLRLAPFLVAPVLIVLAGRQAREGPPPAATPLVGQSDERLVIVIVDSLRRETLEAPGVMPHLNALAQAPGNTFVPLTTCELKFTLPCLATLFEGRESPLAAGIENSFGARGSPSSLPAVAATAGVPVALVSDHVLNALYGRWARTAFDVVSVPPAGSARDLAGAARAVEWLADPQYRLLIVHLPQSDHVSHEHRPGSLEYEEHHRRVDEAVAGLVARLDPVRDSLVVMGDHGHDDRGDHTQESVAIFSGGRFNDLLAVIDLPRQGLRQRDLLFTLAYALSLPLPPGYEGRYFSVEPSEPDAHRWFTRRVQDLESTGLTGEALRRRLDHRWTPDGARAARALRQALPLVACLLAWLLTVLPGGGESSVARAGLGYAALALALQWLSTPTLGPWLAVAPLALGALAVARRCAWRGSAVIVSALALAAATAAAGHRWPTLFHTTGGFHALIPTFFALLLGVGALLARLSGRGLRAWPEHTLLLTWIALPSGVYYYQFDQNILRGFALASGAAALVAAGWRLADTGGGRLSWKVLPWVVPLLLLMPQRSAGWEWELGVIHWLERVPRYLPGAALAVLLATLLLRVQGRRGRLVLGTLLGASGGYSMAFAGLEASRLAGAVLVALFVAEWTRWRRRHKDDEGRPGEEALLLAAAAMLTLLVLLGGFRVNKIDFRFGFSVAQGLQTEGEQLIVIGLLTLVKYALPVWALMAAHALGARRAVLERVHAGVFFFFGLKLLALTLQALLAGLEVRGKYGEMALAEALFLLLLAFVWGVGYLTLASGVHGRSAFERWRGGVGHRAASSLS